MPRRGGSVPQSAQFRRTESDNGLRLCIVLISLSLVMFTASAREGSSGGVFNTIRGAWMTITMPIRWVGSAATTPIQGLGNVFTNLTTDQEKLSELKAENERLAARNTELAEYEQTAKRLESLLGLQSLYNLKSTGARIISGSTDSWSSTVVIDKGSSVGITVGMPVTDANGAIGQIIRCDTHTSTVRLITDENSSVSAMVQASRAQGYLRGSVDGTLRLSLVRTDQTVEVGDTVVTSGLGGVYPKGLPLGTVISVERVTGSMYYSIEVEPFSSAESFEEVLVITSLTEDQRATAEDVAEADKQDSTGGLNSTSAEDDQDTEAMDGESAEDTEESVDSADSQLNSADSQRQDTQSQDGRAQGNDG